MKGLGSIVAPGKLDRSQCLSWRQKWWVCTGWANSSPQNIDPFHGNSLWMVLPVVVWANMFKGFGPTLLGGLQDLVGAPTPNLQGLAVGLGAFRRGPCCCHVTLEVRLKINQPGTGTRRLGTGERDNQRTRKQKKRSQTQESKAKPDAFSAFHPDPKPTP